MYRYVNWIMIILIILLQFRLWSGEGSIPAVREIEELIDQQKAENEKLKQRNGQLYAQIESLSNENQSDEIEGRARTNLGMIKEGETFFLVVEKEPEDKE